MFPQNIPDWGQLVADIHSHTWSDSPLYSYNSNTYQTALGFGQGSGVWQGGNGEGLQPSESPFNFSHDDITQADQSKATSYMIDPSGRQHIYSPF